MDALCSKWEQQEYDDDDDDDNHDFDRFEVLTAVSLE
jgi:hypothetical protein